MAQLKARVVYTPREGTTPQAELNALCAVYRFILDCHAKKKGTRPGGPDDDVKEFSGYAAIPNHIR
jgi:hypothetical protein